MKKLFFTILLLPLAYAVNAQKVINDPNAQVRNVSGFHGIEVSGGIDLYLSNGEEAVAVSAKDEDATNHIITEVKDGILKIYRENKGFVWNNKRGLRAYVSYKTLDRLTASGGSDITTESAIRTTNLSLSLSGGSDLKGRIEAQTLSLDQSGGSDVTLSGSANTISLVATGGSDFKGYEFTAQTCSVIASGGSDVEITVNKELNAQASGGSDIHYRGSATLSSNSKSGGSSIKKTS